MTSEQTGKQNTNGTKPAKVPLTQAQALEILQESIRKVQEAGIIARVFDNPIGGRDAVILIVEGVYIYDGNLVIVEER